MLKIIGKSETENRKTYTVCCILSKEVQNCVNNSIFVVI
jgi:hypothetical protein